MGVLKKLISNNLKQEGKYLLYKLLKIPFNRVNLPVDIMTWLPKGKPINFVDIGGSKGEFSTSIVKFYDVNKGLIIEPIPHYIPILEGLFSDKTKYQILNIAVSDRVGESAFYITEDFDVLSSLFEIKDEYNKPFGIPVPVKTVVKTDTLDNVVLKNNFDSIDLLKLDVQGAEHLVLKSGTNALKMTKLVYSEFSYKPMYEGSSTFFDLFRILTENNFRLVNTSSAYKLQNGEIVQGDALFVNNELLHY